MPSLIAFEGAAPAYGYFKRYCLFYPIFYGWLLSLGMIVFARKFRCGLKANIPQRISH
jgi:hypothetical protein